MHAVDVLPYCHTTPHARHAKMQHMHAAWSIQELRHQDAVAKHFKLGGRMFASQHCT